MTIPIIMFSASGREEWLPKLLLLFLVFGKGKAVLNWLWAVTMWGLTLGKKCWEIFTCISKGHGVWSCAGAALAARSKSWEEVLQKWPWWASTTGSVCACYCAFALHFNSGLCWAHWSSNFTLGDFHYGRVHSGFQYYYIFHFHSQWGPVLLVLTSPLTLFPSLPRLKYPVNLHTQDVQWYHVPMSLHMSRSSWGQGRFCTCANKILQNPAFLLLCW